MGRCTATKKLEVHHKRRDGGNGIENAKVLCQHCHGKTNSYGVPGNSPPEFSKETKDAALKRAGHRCECEETGCHDDGDKLKPIKDAVSSKMRS